jgi:hypothetical protein
VRRALESDLLSLPVVDDDVRRRIIGMVKRADISSTYLRHVHGVKTSGIEDA